jgi:hypothetical protein
MLQALSRLWESIKSLFPTTKISIPKQLDDLVKQAAPIVIDIEGKLKGAVVESAGSGIIAKYTSDKIEKYLSDYESDNARVKEVAAALADKSRAEILSGVAVYLIRKYAPQAPLYLIRLAIELAYFVFVKSKEVADATQAQAEVAG